MPEPGGTVLDKHGRLAGLATSAPVILELGCGSRRRRRDAITIDALDYDAVDVVGDVFDVLARLHDASVDVVYSSHFVEHLSDLPRFIREMRRVVRIGGKVETVVPHFSNPYFYSDYTHRTAFGLYSFSYLAEDRVLRRSVPRYIPETGFVLDRVRLNFKAERPFYVRYALSRLVELLVNCTTLTKEIYERSFCYLFPCYEVEFVIVRRDT